MEDISHIFRSYDVRGIYDKDLNEEIMQRIGGAFAQFTGKDVIVAMDVRTHSATLSGAFIRGVTEAGRNATFIGAMPLGVGMHYAWNRQNYAYITASHLPPEWNGVKFYHESGVGFFEKENNQIRDIVLSNSMANAKEKGKAENGDSKKIIDDYKKYLLSKVRLEKKEKITLDTGNGCAGIVVRDLFTRAGFETEVIYEEIDGTFPNRNPEPGEDPLVELRKRKGLGIAYDGDGDRMLLVYSGTVIQPEQTAYIILSELLKKEKGPVVANVECTRLIDDIAEKFQRNVMRVPVGHTFLVQGVFEHNACFGVETSGHYIIPPLMPIDDSLAVSLYAAKIISETGNVEKLLREMPHYPFERMNFECDDRKKFIVIENLKKKLSKEYKNVNTHDGVRIDFPEGWVLIRASNTGPLIRISIEADSEKDLEKLKEEFTKIVKREMKL